jgi:hypothetical protein
MQIRSIATVLREPMQKKSSGFKEAVEKARK